MLQFLEQWKEVIIIAGAFLSKWFFYMPNILKSTRDVGGMRFVPIIQSSALFKKRVVGYINSFITLVGLGMVISGYFMDNRPSFFYGIAVLVVTFLVSSIPKITINHKLNKMKKDKYSQVSNILDMVKLFVIDMLLLFPIFEILGFFFMSTNIKLLEKDQGGF